MVSLRRAPVETITLSYRSDGQRTQVLRGGDDHEFVYDAFGRLVEQRERSDGVWRTTRFGWDAAGRLRWASLPRAAPVNTHSMYLLSTRNQTELL